ncbi:MAG: alpha-L-fucosidase [Phycisphaerae bacterium]
MPQIAPWFPDAKFGVFIHWTLKNCEMALDEPVGEMSHDLQRQWAREYWTAANYDPKQWAEMFAGWGAKYAVLTTKHHIGFTLFDSPVSRFSAANSAPAGRDLVGPYVDALRAAGLKVGLYYSLPDWSHPDYASCAGGDDRRKYSETDEPERWARFVEDMFAEIRHLCTAYGKIDCLWFDGDWERSAEQWHSVELAAMIQQLQPEAIFNNRLRHRCLGHYGTPESDYPVGARQGFNEFCGTPGDNWDGQAANENIIGPGEMVRLFCDNLTLGMNTMLNVAPHPDGTIPQVQADAMAKLGEWIKPHAEAIYATEGGLPVGLFNGGSSHRDSVLYLYAYDTPRDELVVKGLGSQVKRITHLRTGKELSFRYSGGRNKFGRSGWLFIRVPAEMMDEHATVIRVEFEDDICQAAGPDGQTVRWRGRPVFDEQALYDSRDV